MAERSTPDADRDETMNAFERKYSMDEKEAFLYAYEDRRIRPFAAVLAMAERGELLTKDGRRVRPFTINPNTAKGWSRAARHKARGRVPGAAHENPEGTIDALRRRLIALADDELAYCERQRSGKRDPEHMRQIARAIREAAGIPVKGEVRGRAPGEREPNGHQPDQHTRGGMAGALLKAHRARPAPEQPTTQQAQAENTNASATTHSTNHEHDEPAHDPGSSYRLAETEQQQHQHARIAASYKPRA